MLDGENCVRCGNYTKFEKLKYGVDAYGICSKCTSEIEARQGKIRICPDDKQQMQTHFLAGYRIIIDKCVKCGGIWLEAEDLQELQKVFAERDTANKVAAITTLLSGF